MQNGSSKREVKGGAVLHMGACLILCERCITRADGCPFHDSEDVALVPSSNTTSCAGPFLGGAKEMRGFLLAAVQIIEYGSVDFS